MTVWWESGRNEGERGVVKREDGRMGDHVVLGSVRVGVGEMMCMEKCERV